MDNHQTELGDKLHSEGYNLSSTPDKILSDLEVLFSSGQLGKFKSYPEAKEGVFLNFIDDLLLE